MNVIRALSLWRERFEGVSEEEKFLQLALLYAGAPYEWGAENPLETDCSGLICGPLILMDYEIRITADQILKKLISPHGDVMLIFFIKNDKATHCAIGLGEGAVIHASGSRGVVIESLESVANEYKDSGHHVAIGYLDFNKVKENVGLAYDIDSELH